MNLTVVVPDEHAAEVLEAFTRRHQYRPELLQPDPKNPAALVRVPNPETPQAFVERLLKEHVRGVLAQHRQSLVVMPPVEF